MHSSFSPILVVVSILIGIISCYTSLILIGRMIDRSALHRSVWLTSGSILFGLGIFSMHFVGMLAFHVHEPMTYHLQSVCLALLTAIVSSFIAFFTVYSSTINKPKLVVSGLIIGAGVVLTHYTAIAAIREPITIHYESIYFIASILVGFIFSTVILYCFLNKKQFGIRLMVSNLKAGIGLGLTISLMHYLGMGAISFNQHHRHPFATGIDTFELASFVSTITIIILIAAIVTAVIDYRSARKEKRLLVEVEQSDERFLKLADISPEAIVVCQNKRIVFVNDEFLKMLDVTDKEELMEKSILDFIQADDLSLVQRRIQLINAGEQVKPIEQKLVTTHGVLDVEISGTTIMFQNNHAVQLIIRNITEQRKIAQQLEESQQQYKSLFEQNLAGIYSLDEAGNYTSCNEALKKMLGYSGQQFLTMNFKDIIELSYIDKTKEMFDQALRGEAQQYETAAFHKDGKIVNLVVTNMPIIVDGKIVGVFGVAQDISKEKKFLRLLKENEEKYRSLFDYNLYAVLEVDWSGRNKNVNQMAQMLTGYTNEELLSMPSTSILADNSGKVEENIKVVKEGKPAYNEVQIRRKDGREIDVDVNLIPIWQQQTVIGYFAIMRDITEKKRAQQRINELAYTDQLTGLSNRHSFYRDVELEVMKAQQNGGSLALLSLDFDNFKDINDTYGHQAGDTFLQEISSQLQHHLGEDKLVYRLGGDEFIIMLKNVTQHEAQLVAQQILDVFNQPINLAKREAPVTISIGISMLSNYSRTVDQLMKHVDFALYYAKGQGKNNYQFFTEELYVIMSRKHMIDRALRKAIDNSEFELYYQPLVDIKSGKLVGLEALLRWNAPFGTVAPDEFIPIAEETGWIVPIGEWVIEKVCKQLKIWQEQDGSKVKVCVNISARQFRDTSFMSTVSRIIEREQIDPTFLEFEITETVMLDVDRSFETIQALKDLGIKVAIDDFGVGYSSLSITRNVLIDTLKIDKSVLEDVFNNERWLSFLKAIINIGKELCIEVTVEGIETKEQVNFLKQFSVTGQGYYFSKPLPVDKIHHFIANQ